MRTLSTTCARKILLLCAAIVLTATTSMAQDLLTKNADGYLVDFGQKLNLTSAAENAPVAFILADMSLFDNAKTAKDTAAAWDKISKDKKYFYAVAGKITSIKATTFQLVTKEEFKVNFTNKKLQLFVYANPDNTPGPGITIMKYQKMCCNERCMGMVGMYETLTKCMSGSGRCKTCVDCCNPIMVRY